MKKNILYTIVAMLALTACSGPDKEWVEFNSDDNNGNVFQVLEESDVCMDDIDWYALAEQNADYDDQQESTGNGAAAAARKVSSYAMTDLLREVLDMVCGIWVHQVSGTYKSVDLNGDTLTVSGKVMYPKKGEYKKIILISHYTIGADREAPSQTYPFEGIYAALGYCVIAADYIGYGVTKDQIHPYLQADVCAKNVIDMGLAVRPFLKKREIKGKSDKVILLGYSQGGACTMHTMRLIETDPDYVGKFEIFRTYCGAGPYDVAKTYDYSMKKDQTGIPCAVPMIVQGMSIGMEKPLQIESFFNEPLKSNYKQWLNSKQYLVKEINQLIGSNYLSQIMTPAACDKTNKETARFYKELVANSVPTSYVPTADLYMFHSEDDNTVPFINSQLMQRQFREGMKTNVEYVYGHYGNHMLGAVVFIFKTAVILGKQD